MVSQVVAAFKGWKFLVALLIVCIFSSLLTVGVTFWLQAGPPSKVLAENSIMRSIPAGGYLMVAALRETKRTDCVTSTSRWLERADHYALTPEMRARAPKLPPVVSITYKYPLQPGSIPGVNPGLGVVVFGVIIPKELPPGHYAYRASSTSTCPLVPSRTTKTITPPGPNNEFDVTPPIAGAADAAQIIVNDKAATGAQP